MFEKAVVQRTEHLREAQVKAKAGLKPDIDVYTAQSDLARAQLQLVDARNAAATAKVALDNAMGLGEHAPDYRQSDQLTYEQITDTVGRAHLERAFAQRPDLKMLLDEARAAGAEIKQYRSDYLPRVGGVAGYNVRGQDATPGNNFYAGLVVTWPIFNGFLTDHQVAEARLRQDAVRHVDRGPPAADRAPGEARRFSTGRPRSIASIRPRRPSPPRASNSSLRRSVTRPGWARSSS